MKTAEDSELVRACLEGDQAAFGVLLDRHQKAIFNAALRTVNSYEDARDIAQTVFLKAYENLASYDPSYKFYSWVYRIAINESINFLSRRNRIEPLEGDHASSDPGPEETLAGGEIAGSLQDSMMLLTAEYRIVLILKHFLNCSYGDIAQILQLPEKTVKSRLFTARQRLKETLAQKGILV